MKEKVAVPRSQAVCGLMVCITVFNAMGCVPMYLLIPGVGARRRVRFLNILCFTDVGFEASEGKQKKRLL